MPAPDLFYRRFFTRLFLGPALGAMIGLGFFGLHWALEGIHRLDRFAYLAAYCGLGAFAGFAIGVVWAFNAIWNPPMPPHRLQS